MFARNRAKIVFEGLKRAITVEAKDHFTTAAEMIEETGYHRRDKEVGQWVSGSVGQ